MTTARSCPSATGWPPINWYRQQGFLPEALVNYLALLGWSPGENRESFTMAEMAAEFDLARVNTNAAHFDVSKLEAINGDKIRALEPGRFRALGSPRSWPRRDWSPPRPRPPKPD